MLNIFEIIILLKQAGYCIVSILMYTGLTINPTVVAKIYSKTKDVSKVENF